MKTNSQFLSKKNVIVIIAVASFFGVGFLASSLKGPINNYRTTQHIQNADALITTGSPEIYNINQALVEYEKALALDPTNEKALYNAARVNRVLGNNSESLRIIARYKELYPENKRIHYGAGFAYARLGDLESAEKEFIAFIDSGLSRGFGELDLAWVYFQQGEFEKAKERMEFAITNYGDNVWFNTSLGATLIALGENQAALEVLQKAQEQAASLTVGEWQKSYSFNDPAQFAQEIADMQSVIAYNILLAEGGGSDLELAGRVAEASFATLSPLGYAAGVTVSACAGEPHQSAYQSAYQSQYESSYCVPNAGTPCTTSNICGELAHGTTQCNGSCDASSEDPSGSCSLYVAACDAYATGYNGCNGQCNITQYPVCTTTQNPGGGGEIEWITLPPGTGEGPADIAAEITAVPALVSVGGSSVVYWNSTETDSCAVASSSNEDNWTGRFGTELTSAIIEETTYTLTCEGFDGSSITDTATVRIVPIWQEF